MDFLNHPESVHLINVGLSNRPANDWSTGARPFATLGCRVSGSCTFTSSVGICTVAAPDTLYLSPGVSYHCHSTNEVILSLYFSIPESSDRTIMLIPREFGSCEQAFREIYDAFSQGTNEERFRAQALFSHFLSRLAAFFSRQKDPRIAQALSYMHAHFHEPSLTIEDVAAHVYVSSVFLRLLFKQELGCTPIRQLTTMRIDAAKQLLLQDALPISDIAARCGFSDAKYLSKVFRDATSLTPTQYREIHL